MFPSGKAISARFLFLAVYDKECIRVDLFNWQVLRITCSGVSVGPIPSQLETSRSITTACAPGRISPRWFESLIRIDMKRKTSPATNGWQQFLFLIIICSRQHVHFSNYGKEASYNFAEPHEQGSSRCIRFCTAGVLRRCLYAATWRSVSGQKTTWSVFWGN